MLACYLTRLFALLASFISSRATSLDQFLLDVIRHHRKADNIQSVILVGQADQDLNLLNELSTKLIPTMLSIQVLPELALRDVAHRSLVFALPPLNTSIVSTRAATWWYLPQESSLDRDRLRLDSQVYIYSMDQVCSDDAEAECCANSEDISEDVSAIRVQEVFSVKGQPKALPFATWSPSKGLRVTPTYIWERRSDLSGVHFVALVEDTTPHVIVPTMDNVSAENVTGSCVDLFKTLQNLMNFSYEVALSPDRVWGTLDKETGLWNGLVKMLSAHEGDLAIGPISVTPARIDVIDFAVPYYMEVVRLYVRRSSSESHSLSMAAFFKDLSSEFWLCLCTTVLLLAMGFLSISVVGRERLHAESDPERFGPANSVAVVCLALVQHDYPLTSAKLHYRILHLSTALWGFLCFAHYSALLTSVLTVKQVQYEIESLQDILDKNYQLLIPRGTSYESNFRDSPPDTVQGRIWSNIMTVNPRNLFPNFTEGIKRINAEPRMVLFGSLAGTRWLLKNTLKDISGDIIELRQDYERTHESLAFPPDSDLTPLFSYQLLKMIERGQIDRIDLDYSSLAYHPREAADAKAPSSIDIETIASGFIYLVAGALSSLTALACEIAITKRRSSQFKAAR